MLLVAEYNADGDLFWHIVTANLRDRDLRYELVDARRCRRHLFDAYWSKFLIERIAKADLRMLVRPSPALASKPRPPTPEEVSRWRDILERD